MRAMRFNRASGYCRLFSIALLALSASLYARGQPAVDNGAKGDIRVEDAWIRWLPANLPGAGYMTLTNAGSVVHVLADASSPDYGDVSIHETHEHNGMIAMSPADSITLQPHTTIRFAEGGSHLMLMQPKRSLHPGDRVLVALHFTGGLTVTVPFEVRTGSESGAAATATR
jgi:copper(I)-binding protein